MIPTCHEHHRHEGTEVHCKERHRVVEAESESATTKVELQQVEEVLGNEIRGHTNAAGEFSYVLQALWSKNSAACDRDAHVEDQGHTVPRSVIGEVFVLEIASLVTGKLTEHKTHYSVDETGAHKTLPVELQHFTPQEEPNLPETVRCNSIVHGGQVLLLVGHPRMICVSASFVPESEEVIGCCETGVTLSIRPFAKETH